MPLQGTQTTPKHHVFQVTVTICNVDSGPVAAGEVRETGVLLYGSATKTVDGCEQNTEFTVLFYFSCVLCIFVSDSGVTPNNKGIEAPSSSKLIPDSQGCISPAWIG